jgi:putative oxidoreductase
VTSQSHDPRSWRSPNDLAAPVSGRHGSARLVDPEDDLPSASYSGDFETTAIPRYDSSSSSNGNPGLGLIGDPEPLPYVQPGGRHAADFYAAEPAEIEPDAATDQRVRVANRRGTQNLGLLLLRAGIGAVLIAHGLQKAFGWWGGQGLSGFRSTLAEMGYQHANVLTYVATGTEVATGALLVLGLFTPLAAAGALAYLVNSVLANVAAQHATGYITFFLPAGNEYQVTLIVALSAIILSGPGRYGLDGGRGWAGRPFVGSFIALLVGIGGGVAVWALLNGANPLA